MAYTLFAEKNRVNWVGVRPGVYGEQVCGGGNISNAILTLYTVPAGKTLLLFGCFLSARNTAGATAEGILFIANAASVLQYYLAQIDFAALIGTNNVARDLTMPIEVPAGWLIRLQSTTVACVSWGNYNGILVDPLVSV